MKSQEEPDEPHPEGVDQAPPKPGTATLATERRQPQVWEGRVWRRMSFPRFPSRFTSARGVGGLGHKDPPFPRPYLSRPRWTGAGRSCGRRRRRRCRFGSGRGDRARTRRAAVLPRCSPDSQPSPSGSREGQGGEGRRERRERGGEGGERESLRRKSRPSPPTAPPERGRPAGTATGIWGLSEPSVLCLHRGKAKVWGCVEGWGGWGGGGVRLRAPRSRHFQLSGKTKPKQKPTKNRLKNSRANGYTTSVFCNRVPSLLPRPSPAKPGGCTKGIAPLQPSGEGNESNLPPPSPSSFLRFGLQARGFSQLVLGLTQRFGSKVPLLPFKSEVGVTVDFGKSKIQPCGVICWCLFYRYTFRT